MSTINLANTNVQETKETAPQKLTIEGVNMRWVRAISFTLFWMALGLWPNESSSLLLKELVISGSVISGLMFLHAINKTSK